MSILTKKEREGLEDVFLSIEKQNKITCKPPPFLELWGNNLWQNNKDTSAKIAQTENFRDRLISFFNFFSKVKKILSK